MTDKAGKKPDPQMEIDWVRGKRRTWIERLILPPFDYTDANGIIRQVRRTATMKHLLRVIESHARDGGPCFLKEETIYRQMNISESTLRRALGACVGRGLLTFDRSFFKGVASRYQIEWSGVAQAILDHPDTAGLIDQQQSKNLQATPVKLTVTPVNLETTPVKLEVTPVKLTEGHTSIPRTRGLKPSLNHERKPQRKPCADDSDSQDFGGYRGWPHKIELRHLMDRDEVQRLFQHACNYGYVNSTDRDRFFRLARYSARGARDGWILDAGAYFAGKLKQKQWMGDAVDERAAIDAIMQVDAANSDHLRRQAQQSAARGNPFEATSQQVSIDDKVAKLSEEWGCAN